MPHRCRRMVDGLARCRGASGAHGVWWTLALVLAWLAAAIAIPAGPAWALKPIVLTGEQDRLEVSALGEAHESRGDTLQIEMAPGADGASARMAVRATTPGSSPNWMVFALTNPTSKAIELWLTADRYSPIGSGIVWPDLDARRISAVAHSAGFAPERVRNDRIDIFRLTIERGQTVTYVAELASERFTRLTLWKPIEFEQRQRERQLFNGIMLGITGLLAVFLTAVFAANHKSIFPVAGLVAWCALALLCVDFGFWHKLFQMKPEDNAQYRAAAEAALAASLVLFLGAFLRVNLWSAFARTLFLVWVVAQLAIVAVAVLDPRLAATVARLSLGFVGAFGFTLILVLALRGLDRALALMPTWILFLVWLFGAAVTLTGRMAGEFAISGLVAGLVLILVLIGFTVTQYAFRTGEPLLGSSTGGQQMRLAALDRAGVAFWEWNLRRDEVRVDAEVEALLGLAPGELPTRVEELLAYVHPADRERFRQELLAIREQHGGTLHTGIRLRHADSSYRWLQFEGASVPTSDRRNLRCVGLVRDTTDQKRAQERLLLNAVFDSLTSLPNRELFLDRLSGILHRTAGGAMPHVTVIVVDVDRFRSVNATFGLVVGDSIILTVSRRLARIAGSDAALARVGGDQFALFLVDQTDPRELASFAERLRLSLRSPIRIAGQEIVLTGSIGIAVHDGRETTARELMRDAEIAMHRAKRLGSDRAEIFGPQMQTERAERAELERDLAKAIDEARLTVLWQPVVSLANDELVGFEATVRWQHPKLGVVSPVELAPLAERADLVTRLGAYLLGQVLAGAARWQQELPRPEHPLFVTVSLTSRQLLSPELIQEIRQAKARTMLPAGSLRLAIPETLVMDNPEQASHVLELLREAGVELWMDRFGTGYSSLAYLGRFPFDAFKIDKALVEWSGQGERDAALVRSIVAVAFELGRKVVGDGVGNAEDAAFLRSIGCHYAQGFHYGDPMRDEEVVRLLRLIRSSERRMRRRGMVRGQEKKKGVEAVPDIPATITTLPPAETPAPQGSGAYPFTGQPSAAPYPSGNGSAQPPFAGGPVTGHPQTGRPQPAMQAPPPQQRVPPASPSAPPGAMRADPGTRPGPLQPDPVSRPIHAAVPPATGAQGAMPAPQAMSGKGFTPQPQQPPPQAPSQTGKSGVTLGGAPAAHGSASSVSRPADVAAPRPMTRPAPPQPTVRASDLPHPMPERPAAPPSQPQSGLSRGEQAAAVAAAREAAAMQPQLTDPETSSRTSRQHTRRTGPALSPAVAASLARLAGKSEGSAAHNPDAPGPAPGGRSGVKAAE